MATKDTTQTKHEKEVIFIGVSWPYANGELTIGHLAGQNVVCDVFARFHRQIGNNVLMVSGADAHGTPVTIRAEKDGMTPEQAAQKYFELQAETFNKLNCQWDFYTTTESENHKEVAQNLFKVMYDKGFIEPKEIEQYYDTKANKFLADRYIEGTCPHCGNEKARGDQCNDGCERTLDPSELINPKSTLTGTTPIFKKHVVLYFTLDRFQKEIEDYVKSREGIWRQSVLSVVKSWLKEGLKPRAVTRELGYGVKVPVPEYSNQDIYVWFEAVMGYLSAAIGWAKSIGEDSRWEYFWKNPTAKHYYFIAKDNIPFHTFLWPAMIMAYNSKYDNETHDPDLPGEDSIEPLQLPYDVPSNQFLNLKGKKLSKSRGTMITARELLDKYNPDLVRFFFTRNAPENHDKEFEWKDFIDTNNNELVATYGNFIYRTLSFLYHKLDNKLAPEITISKPVRNEIEKAFKEVGEALRLCQFVRASESLMELAHYGNKYFNDAKPWETVKTDPSVCALTIYDCVQMIYALGILSRPFMPATSEKILSQLNQPKDATKIGWKFSEIKKFTPIPEPQVLFEKLEYIEDEGEPVIDTNVVVGKILEIEAHPNADKLHVTKVDIGEKEPVTIVCGAPNIKVGDIVPVVKPGGIVNSPEGEKFTVTPKSIRGVESHGMLCSQLELGLGKDHEGIWILPPEYEKFIGKSVVEVYKAK